MASAHQADSGACTFSQSCCVPAASCRTRALTRATESPSAQCDRAYIRLSLITQQRSTPQCVVPAPPHRMQQLQARPHAALQHSQQRMLKHTPCSMLQHRTTRCPAARSPPLGLSLASRPLPIQRTQHTLVTTAALASVVAPIPAAAAVGQQSAKPLVWPCAAASNTSRAVDTIPRAFRGECLVEFVEGMFQKG